MPNKKTDTAAPLLTAAHLRCFTKLADEELDRREAKRQKQRNRRKERQSERAKAEDEIIAASRLEEEDLKQLRRATPEALRLIEQVGGPWPYQTLTIDAETTTSALSGQALRFLYFQLRGLPYENSSEGDDTILGHALKGDLTRAMLDCLTAHGLVYDADHLNDPKDRLTKFVARYNKLIKVLRPGIPPLKLMNRDEFVTKYLCAQPFANWHKKIRDPRMLVGHNPIYDLGALARKTTKSRGKTYGGLSLKFCSCDGDENSCIKHGNIIWKKLGRSKYFYKRSEFFADATVGAANDHSDADDNYVEQPFIVTDTLTLARALHGAGTSASLETLSRKYNVKHKKLKGVEHDRPLTWRYILYCMRDVQSTFEIFQHQRDTYKKYGLKKPLAAVFSGASIGKGYLEALDIPPFMKAQSDFDHKATGVFMEGYGGGRSDVNIRLQICEIVYGDFKSQYPLVNALLRNQDFYVAERIEARWDHPAAKVFLEDLASNTLGKLLSKGTWPMLRGAALIAPDNDVIPIRAPYDGSNPAGCNIGLAIVKPGGPPLWVLLPDIAVSILKTGRCPNILRTVELVPRGTRSTKSVCVYGDSEFEIDLAEHDLFCRAIDLRTRMKKSMKSMKPGPERDRLDDDQTGVKEMANATSYGIPVEVVAEEQNERSSMDVYFGEDYAKVQSNATKFNDNGEWILSGFKTEYPGKYFGPWGPLIPAGGRLLLSMVEKLASDVRITYSHCDTDSMSFVRPAHMGREEFHDYVNYIADKLQSLNPFETDAPIFEIEDINFKLAGDGTGEVNKKIVEPLYFLGISPKRYAVANLINGRWVIRKATGHGAQNVFMPADYDPLLDPLTCDEHVAAKLGEDGKPQYGRIANGGAARLMLDLWRVAFQVYNEDPSNAASRLKHFISKHPQLQVPQSSRLELTTAHAWETYVCGENPIPNARPGMFLQTLPAPVYRSKDQARAAKHDERAALDRSLVADGGLKLSRNLSDYPLDAEGKPTGLYWRDTHKFPYELFENQEPIGNSPDDYDRLYSGKKFNPHLKTVAETLASYFDRPNWKSATPRGVGTMQMREVVLTGRIYVGKATSPLVDITEGDDFETLEEYEGSQTVVDFILHAPILDQIDLAALSRQTGISQPRLERIRSGAVKAFTKEAKLIVARLTAGNDGSIRLKPFDKTPKSQAFNEMVRNAGLKDGYEKISTASGVSKDVLWLIGDDETEVKLTGTSVKIGSKVVATKSTIIEAIKDVSGAGRVKARRRKHASAERKRQVGVRAAEIAAAIAAGPQVAEFSIDELMWQPEPVEAPTKAKRAAKERSIGARNMRAALKAWNALHEIAPQFPKVDVAEFRPVDFAYHFEVKTLDGETRFVDPMTAFEYFEKWKRRRLKNVEAVKKYRYEATEA